MQKLHATLVFVCALSTIAVAQTTVPTPSPAPTASAPADTAPQKADKKSKKKDDKKKDAKSATMKIDTGTLTVDGMIAKARLNYDVHGKYLYFYVPDVGVAIVSPTQFDKAEKQKDAFQDKTLTVAIAGHQVELSNEKSLMGKKHDAWVKVDPTYRDAESHFPMMGFGDSINAPYKWPGAKPAAEIERGSFSAPPIPTNLQPKLQTASGYTVIVKAQK